jgi:hypothetical protein
MVLVAAPISRLTWANSGLSRLGRTWRRSSVLVYSYGVRHGSRRASISRAVSDPRGELFGVKAVLLYLGAHTGPSLCLPTDTRRSRRAHNHAARCLLAAPLAGWPVQIARGPSAHRDSRTSE